MKPKQINNSCIRFVSINWTSHCLQSNFEEIKKCNRHEEARKRKSTANPSQKYPGEMRGRNEERRGGSPKVKSGDFGIDFRVKIRNPKGNRKKIMNRMKFERK